MFWDMERDGRGAVRLLLRAMGTAAVVGVGRTRVISIDSVASIRYDILAMTGFHWLSEFCTDSFIEEINDLCTRSTSSAGFYVVG